MVIDHGEKHKILRYISVIAVIGSRVCTTCVCVCIIKLHITAL